MIRFSKYTLPILLFFIASSIFAQDMVKDGGQDGLMKTVTYDVSRFTDIRDKKLSDVMMEVPKALKEDGIDAVVIGNMSEGDHSVVIA